MVEEKKVSVVFFLNKRMKGEKYQGEINYPIYARVNFSGNNTKIRVLDRYGEGVYSTEENFKEFEQLLGGNEIEKSWLRSGSSILLLDKEILLIRAIKKLYQDRNDKFSFSEFTEIFKFWEKDLYKYIKELFNERLLSFTKDNVEINAFKALNIKEVSLSDGEFSKWEKAINNSKIPSDLSLLAEAMICYLHFIKGLLHGKYKRGFMAGIPTTRGTIFSWLYEEDKKDFKEWLKNPGNIKTTTTLGGFASINLCSEFLNFFRPQHSKANQYPQVISDNIS